MKQTKLFICIPRDIFIIYNFYENFSCFLKISKMINRQTLLMGKANFVEFKNIQRVNSVTLSAYFYVFHWTSLFCINFRRKISFLYSVFWRKKLKSDWEEFIAKAVKTDEENFSIKIVKSTHCREGITQSFPHFLLVSFTTPPLHFITWNPSKAISIQFKFEITFSHFPCFSFTFSVCRCLYV